MTTPVTPDKTPEWMLLLEKKKNRPHRLAHEIGAGAPCLQCEDKCPGLDLHFWRKVCRNCKCKKEEHDVKDDDGYQQFEILLGGGVKRKKPGAVLNVKVPDQVDVGKGVEFDWVPPNVTEDLATEYMQNLPAAKLPISGSDGALYRRQQMERQMPLHDLDATKCHNLSAHEIQQLEKYLDNVKNNVVGQGRVNKIPVQLYKEQRYRQASSMSRSGSVLHQSYSDSSIVSYNAGPVNLTDPDLPPPLPTSLPPDFDDQTLTTPPYDRAASVQSSSVPYSDVVHSSSVPGKKYPGSRSQHGAGYVPSSIPGQHYPGGNPQDCSMFAPQNSFDLAHSTSVPGQHYPGSIPADGSFPPQNIPGQHYSNSNSKDGSFIAPQNSYDLAHSQSVPGQHYPGSIPGDGSEFASQNSYDLAHSQSVPGQHYPGLNPTDGSFPPQSIPGQHYSNSNSKDGSGFAPQNSYDLAHFQSVPGKHYPGLNPGDGSGFPPQNIPGQHYQGSNSGDGSFVPQNIPGQNLPNSNSNDGSFAPQNSYDLAHSQSVPGQHYPAHSQSVPGQHYPAHSQSVPGQHYLDVKGQDCSMFAPHNTPPDHNTSPTGTLNSNPSQALYERSRLTYDLASSTQVNTDSMPRSAQVVDNDLALRLKFLSAEEHHVESYLDCKHCGGILKAGDVAVFADRAGESVAWHPKCFVCNTCDEMLVDLIYFFSKGNVYCGRHFAELLDIPRCYACDELIFVKEYTVAEGKTFHVKHFCCYDCDEPLAGKQYVPTNNNQPMCLDCYQHVFGKKCNTCRKQIQAGHQRVGWKEINWHADDDCFRCNGCRRSLLGGRFVMRDEQPYCNKDCFALISAR